MYIREIHHIETRLLDNLTIQRRQIRYFCMRPKSVRQKLERIQKNDLLQIMYKRIFDVHHNRRDFVFEPEPFFRLFQLNSKQEPADFFAVQIFHVRQSLDFVIQLFFVFIILSITSYLILSYLLIDIHFHETVNILESILDHQQHHFLRLKFGSISSMRHLAGRELVPFLVEFLQLRLDIEVSVRD